MVQTRSSVALTEALESRGSAQISVGAGSGRITLFVLDGHLIGAEAGDDVPCILERLEQRGALTSMRARQLRTMAKTAGSILGSRSHDPILGLITDEVPSVQLSALLLDRFEENVGRFLNHSGFPTKEASAPWTENLQVGHDTPELVARCTKRLALGRLMQDGHYVKAGRDDGTPQLAAVLTSIGTGHRTVAELLRAMDSEPIAARAQLAQWVKQGALVSVHPTRPATPSSRPRSVLGSEELDAFSGDADRYRGPNTKSSFTTERQQLDRVELTPSAPSKSSARFSAPALSSEEAQQKIDVANDVLGAISMAFDQVHGPGSGRRTVQVLVDGRPRAFAPLLDGIQTTSAGALPNRDVLANLRKRPKTEHRRLLKDGLLDLLDRAMDKAADALNEEALDDVLHATVGYRQRMGL